jgi:hypothetical protein
MLFKIRMRSVEIGNAGAADAVVEFWVALYCFALKFFLASLATGIK